MKKWNEHLVACHGYDESISERPEIALKDEESIFDKPTFEDSPVILDVRKLKQYFPIKTRKRFLEKKIKIFLGILNSLGLITSIYAMASSAVFTGILFLIASILSFGDVALKTKKGRYEFNYFIRDLSCFRCCFHG